MLGHSAQRDVRVSVGTDFIIIGTDRVEVSPDGKKVTAYTNAGVETQAVVNLVYRDVPQAGTHISADFNTVVLNGAMIERAADGHLVISTPGIVIAKPAVVTITSACANENAIHENYLLRLQDALDTALRATVSLPDKVRFERIRIIEALATAKGAAAGLVTSVPSRAAPLVGEEMEDGTILAGYYEGKALYATPADAPGTYTFNEAATYAKNLAADGHHDFRVPSKDELNVLWENHNKGRLTGTFNVTGLDPGGWYWSSSPDVTRAWAQRLSDGCQVNIHRNNHSSLRCVR